MMRIITVWMVLGLATASAADADGDGVDDAVDTCPNTADASNVDSDGDGWGDACVAVGATVASTAVLGEDAFVHAGATVEDHVFIGDYAVVRTGALLAARCQLESAPDASSGVDIGDAVIGRRAHLEVGTSVADDAVLSRAVRLRHGASVGVGAAVGYAADVGAEAQIGAGALVGSLVTVGPGSQLMGTVARGAEVRGDVAAGATVGPEVAIAGGATIGAMARLRKGVEVGSEVTVGNGARIGRDVRLERLAAVEPSVRVGARAVVGSNAVVSTPVGRGATVAAAATSGRGVWHWQDSGHPSGTGAVVGTPASETAVLADLTALDVTHHYGSYVNRPVTEPAVIASWVSSLHAQGTTATVLLGDPLWIDPSEHAFMLSLIDQRLLNYNAARTNPDERFDGLHLDIEPQGDPTWSTATASEKRDRVLALRDALHVVRDHLDANGGASLSLAADLPVWFDNLPPALGGTGSVGWTSEAERDAWFANLPVDVISMMAYERSSLGSITGGVATEDRLFRGELRVGIDHDGVTFADLPSFLAMADALEAAGYPVELHSYSDVASAP